MPDCFRANPGSAYDLARSVQRRGQVARRIFSQDDFANIEQRPQI